MTILEKCANEAPRAPGVSLRKKSLAIVRLLISQACLGNFLQIINVDVGYLHAI